MTGTLQSKCRRPALHQDQLEHTGEDLKGASPVLTMAEDFSFGQDTGDASLSWLHHPQWAYH